MIENYTLTREQAEKIPFFYHPESAETDLPEGVSSPQHDLSSFPPIFTCRIEPGVRCILKLRNDAPLIEYVDLEADIEDVFKLGKQRLEEIFGFELTYGR